MELVRAKVVEAGCAECRNALLEEVRSLGGFGRLWPIGNFLDSLSRGGGPFP